MAARLFGVHDSVGYKSKFPQHRVERLMNLDRNCGLTSCVLVEGPFIELSSDGLPLQQVYLGLTSEELIIVKQKISFYIDITNRNDLELEGLLIDAIFQLSDISFSVSEDRPRTFSVTLPGGKFLTFEMCKLDPGFRTQWNIWRNIISETVEHRQVSNNSVETFCSETLESRQIVDPVILKGTDESSSSDSDMGISSADSYDLISDPNRFGAVPSRRLAFMYGGNPIHFLPINGCDRQQTESVIKSSSWSDVTSGRFLSKVGITSFQKLLQKREKFNSRNFNSELLFDSCSDTSEDDGEDIDTMFHEARTIQEGQDAKRSGAHLWCRARQLVRGSCHRSQLEDTQNHIVFQTLSASRRKPTSVARSILDCCPLDIAQELTIMSGKLLLTIRPRDLEECRYMSSSHVPRSLKRLATFGDNVRKFVVAEILSKSVLSDRLTMLRFFIDVSYYLLFTKRDFQSLICVLRGMTSLPVYRLQNTWATLFVQEPLKFSQFQAMASLLSPAGSYKSYRTRVNLCNARNSSYIPWLDHFMVHCKRKNHSPSYLDLTTGPLMDAQKMSCRIQHKNVQSNRITTQDVMKEKSVNRKARKKVQPLLIPVDSTASKPLKSILKLQENQKKQKGIARLLGMIRLKKSKKVKFLLSDIDLHRIMKSETNDSNMKHLAKTRLYPVDLRGDLDPVAELVAEDPKKVNNRLVVTPAIERYCEQKSKEIIYETYKSFVTNLAGKEKHLSDRTKLNRHEHRSEDFDRKPEGKIVDLRQQGVASDGFTTHVKEVPDKAKSFKNNPFMKLLKPYKKMKDKRRTKKDIKHVNYLQSEIDSINTLLKDFEHMKHDDADKDEESVTDSVKDTQGQGQPNARLAASNNEHPGQGPTNARLADANNKQPDQDPTNARLAGSYDKHPDKERGDKAEKRETRRKSYVPASVIENRRISLFEQAFDVNKDQDIDKVFSRSMEMRLKGLQGRRRSVAMELLENDETLGLDDGWYQNSCNNSTDGDATPRCRYFDPENSNNYLCFKSCSLENLGTSCVGYKGCMYCGGDTCIYPGSILDHLTLLQTNVINAQEVSSKHVRECLKNMINSVTNLSNYDLMALSISRE